MIIECINCNKKFDVNSELIPTDGRTIQCGSCNYVWFFNKNYQNQENTIDPSNINLINKKSFKAITKENKPQEEIISPIAERENAEIVKHKNKSNYRLSKLLSYLLILIVSFLSLIIILDTFKILLYDYFPNLELFLFSLFETFEDVKLFIKDLI